MDYGIIDEELRCVKAMHKSLTEQAIGNLEYIISRLKYSDYEPLLKSAIIPITDKLGYIDFHFSNNGNNSIKNLIDTLMALKAKENEEK